MIEIDIPSIDPIQHEPKIFFGMTSRQCICVIVGGILGVIAAVALWGVSQDAAIIGCGVCVVPAVFMGWYKPYNMKCEDFLKLMYFNNFVANAKRIYKTDTEEERKYQSIKERQEEEQKSKEKALEDKKNKKSGKLNGKERL